MRRMAGISMHGWNFDARAPFFHIESVRSSFDAFLASVAVSFCTIFNFSERCYRGEIGVKHSLMTNAGEQRARTVLSRQSRGVLSCSFTKIVDFELPTDFRPLEKSQFDIPSIYKIPIHTNICSWSKSLPVLFACASHCIYSDTCLSFSVSKRVRR